MNRLFTLVVTVLVVVGTVGVMPGALAQSTETTTPTPTESTTGNASIAPGERMAGVVGVGEAEVSGEVSARAFAFAVANASSNETRAAIIARQVHALDRNVASLRERQEELRRAHENGSISEGRYRAETARLVAQTRTVTRLANGTENATRGMPAALLQRNGVNASAIQRLRLHANELTGPEVAAIARSIAGPRVGKAMGRGPPSDLAGPPVARGPQRSGNETVRGPGQGQGQGASAGPPGNQTVGPNQGTGPGSGPQGPPGANGNRSSGRNQGGQRGQGG